MSQITDNIASVRKAIERAAERAGREAAEVRLIAVSKTKTAEMIREAIDFGQLDFGENYAQELRDKHKEIEAPGLAWHFIGHLQRNKVKYVTGKVRCVHSVDNMSLAQEIDRRSEKDDVTTRILIEVNMGREDKKYGVLPEEAFSMVKAASGLDNIEVAGLMTMPPYFDDPESVRPLYGGLRDLRDKIRKESHERYHLPELSMGLSHDFEIAVEEGATMVRVGTAIFGARA